jgi:hypothetical protein
MGGAIENRGIQKIKKTPKKDKTKKTKTKKNEKKRKKRTHIPIDQKNTIYDGAGVGTRCNTITTIKRLCS